VANVYRAALRDAFVLAKERAIGTADAGGKP
jgi:hypothetical protein